MLDILSSRPRLAPQKAAAAASLKDHVVVMTGVTRPLGQAVSFALAAEGAHIIALSRNQARLAAYDDALRHHTGRHATLALLDVKDDASINQLGPSLAARFGRCDGCLLMGSHHGGMGLRPITDSAQEQWQQSWHLHVTLTWRLMRTLHPLWSQAPHAALLCVLPAPYATALTPFSEILEGEQAPFLGPYYASIGALHQMLRTYRRENRQRAPLVEGYVAPMDPLAHPDIAHSITRLWMEALAP